MATDKTVSKLSIRDAVISAAADLFQDRGFSSTSMQDIADSVGLSRPALYYHFKSKNDILTALVDQVTLRPARETVRIASTLPDRDPRSILREVVRLHALWILENPQQFSVLQREERHLPESVQAIQRKGKRELLDSFGVIIEDGIKAGTFRNVDAKATALCIFGMCNWTVEWFRPGGRLHSVHVAEMIADFSIAMVRRPVTDNADDPMSPMTWISILRDDISRLEAVLPGKGASGKAPSEKPAAGKAKK